MKKQTMKEVGEAALGVLAAAMLLGLLIFVLGAL